MTRTVYYTATSVDGYIADQDNSLDWLFQVSAEGAEQDHTEEFATFFASIGAFAMGATTYEWIMDREPPENWRKYYADTPCWVFTHRDLAALPGAAITFVSGDVRPVHQAMAEAAQGKGIWLVGGGELVGAFADQGLLDEIVLGVAPVTLGGGAPLLPRRLLSNRLALTGVKRTGQFAQLTYSVGNP